MQSCSRATSCMSLSARSSWPRPIVSHSRRVSGSTSAIFQSFISNKTKERNFQFTSPTMEFWTSFVTHEKTWNQLGLRYKKVLSFTVAYPTKFQQCQNSAEQDRAMIQQRSRNPINTFRLSKRKFKGLMQRLIDYRPCLHQLFPLDT